MRMARAAAPAPPTIATVSAWLSPAIPVVIQMLRHEDDQVHTRAHRLLGRIGTGSPQALDALHQGVVLCDAEGAVVVPRAYAQAVADAVPAYRRNTSLEEWRSARGDRLDQTQRGYTELFLAQGGTYAPALMLVAQGVPPERRGSAVGAVIAAASLGYRPR